MEQLILHLIGDYVTQSDWMANNKTKSDFPALVHATVYMLPFFLLTSSWSALFTIWFTHWIIDRYRLARYVVWVKNLFYPLPYDEGFGGWVPENKYDWENCKVTGYPSETPPFLAVWLMIIADNTMHLSINYLALRFL